MTKPNYGDQVVDKLHQRFDKVSAKLREQFKGVNPFRKETIPGDELYFYYRQLSPDDMNYLIQRHGTEAMNDFLFEMSKIEKDKRRRYA